MPEYTITIESAPDTTRDEGALVRFSEALHSDPRALGPSASMDVDRGTLGAVFQVEAPTTDDAAFVGCFAYWGAMADAGLELRGDSHVDVREGDDADASGVERFSARVLLERAA